MERIWECEWHWEFSSYPLHSFVSKIHYLIVFSRSSHLPGLSITYLHPGMKTWHRSEGLPTAYSLHIITSLTCVTPSLPKPNIKWRLLMGKRVGLWETCPGCSQEPGVECPSLAHRRWRRKGFPRVRRKRRWMSGSAPFTRLYSLRRWKKKVGRRWIVYFSLVHPQLASVNSLTWKSILILDVICQELVSLSLLPPLFTSLSSLSGLPSSTG